MSVNKVILIGRLGKDPEVKYTKDNLALGTFTIATSESWKDKANGEKKELTEWHRILIIGKMAEICKQYLTKGMQVYVEGKIRSRQWEDKEKIKRTSTEILAIDVQFLEKAKAKPLDAAVENIMNPYSDMGNDNQLSDELPF